MNTSLQLLTAALNATATLVETPYEGWVSIKDWLARLSTHKLVIHFIFGPMCTLSILICAWSIYQHLRAPGSDVAHALTIRILLMVPIYSFVSWLSLFCRFTSFAMVLQIFEKLYECITLFAFLQLLVVYLGGGRRMGAIERCRDKLTAHDCHHLIPVKWLIQEDSWARPARFLRKSIGLVAWYVPIMLVCFIVTAIAYFTPFIKEVASICGGVNVAYTCVAMYGLLLFYHANMSRLERVKPLAKFASIKVLVIVMGWQEAGLKLAGHYGLFDDIARRSRSHYTSEEFSESVLSALMIVEMLILSFVHICVYPPGEVLYDIELWEETACDSPLPDPGAGEGAASVRVSRRAFLVLNLGDIASFFHELNLTTKFFQRDSQEMEMRSRNSSESTRNPGTSTV